LTATMERLKAEHQEVLRLREEVKALKAQLRSSTRPAPAEKPRSSAPPPQAKASTQKAVPGTGGPSK